MYFYIMDLSNRKDCNLVVKRLLAEKKRQEKEYLEKLWDEGLEKFLGMKLDTLDLNNPVDQSKLIAASAKMLSIAEKIWNRHKEESAPNGDPYLAEISAFLAMRKEERKQKAAIEKQILPLRAKFIAQLFESDKRRIIKVILRVHDEREKRRRRRVALSIHSFVMGVGIMFVRRACMESGARHVYTHLFRAKQYLVCKRGSVGRNGCCYHAQKLARIQKPSQWWDNILSCLQRPGDKQTQAIFVTY
ncbi:MAG TPA: hypothetical protein VFJ29_07440 [Candidatus Kapabacteria bacterium]|nr:hypothetical protein [Candidatus Kapabacteria bacterium]